VLPRHKRPVRVPKRMRNFALVAVFTVLSGVTSSGEVPASCSLTIVVHGISNSKGVLGLVIFNTPKGWPEDVSSSFRHTAFRAQAGTQTVSLPDIPPGRYAVALIHDINENMKLDKNWVGIPKEQWGISNNPRARFSPPAFDKAVFYLKQDTRIDIHLQ
jgi:uncharacterized protein (DUF2141 family)